MKSPVKKIIIKGNKIRFLATALDGSGVKKIVTVKVK